MWSAAGVLVSFQAWLAFLPAQHSALQCCLGTSLSICSAF